MKHRNSLCALAVLSLAALACAASAQFPARQRPFNALAVTFRQEWDAALPDSVKLIDAASVTGDKHSSLLMLVDAGTSPTDLKRKLLVTHWDGFRFATDASIDLLGSSIDALLTGRFRAPEASPAAPKTAGDVKPEPPKKGHEKKPPALPLHTQIVTTEGVYEWNGKSFTRLFSGPTNLRLALVLEKAPDQLLSGTGDNTILYQVGENAVLISSTDAPGEGPGYVRFGVGTQEYPGHESLDISQGIRYVQSVWSNREKWFIGLVRGTPAATPNAPNATTGDRLVVYIPKPADADRSFWTVKPTDLDEAWRSAPLPGRVLDVRVGDPKGSGRPGILVLTAENNDKQRHLYFFAPVSGMMGAR